MPLTMDMVRKTLKKPSATTRIDEVILNHRNSGILRNTFGDDKTAKE